MKILPDMYQKDIFSINYEKLKSKKISVLLFDFDNTLIEKGNSSANEKIEKLMKSLKKDFTVYVVSNSINSKKLKSVCNKLDLPYISFSRKPLKFGFKKLNFSVDNSNIAMIGDQIITDCLGAIRMGYFSILIDPISKNEFFLTKINRLLEEYFLKKINIKRGSYYD